MISKNTLVTLAHQQKRERVCVCTHTCSWALRTERLPAEGVSNGGPLPGHTLHARPCTLARGEGGLFIHLLPTKVPSRASRLACVQQTSKHQTEQRDDQNVYQVFKAGESCQLRAQELVQALAGWEGSISRDGEEERRALGTRRAPRTVIFPSGPLAAEKLDYRARRTLKPSLTHSPNNSHQGLSGGPWDRSHSFIQHPLSTSCISRFSCTL